MDRRARQLGRRRLVLIALVSAAMAAVATAVPVALTSGGSRSTVKVIAPPTTPTTGSTPPSPSPTMTGPAGSVPVPPSATTTAPVSTTSPTTDLAVATASGVTLSVVSSPRQGLLGQTDITATATLTGHVAPGTLDFSVGIGPSDQGQAASSQSVAVPGPGRYSIPEPYHPTEGANWAVGVSYNPIGAETLVSVSGEAPSFSGAVPYPQLVTTVAPGARRSPDDLYSAIAGDYVGSAPGRQSLRIAQDGTAVLTGAGLVACPACAAAVVDFTLLTLESTSTPVVGYQASGVVTAASDPRLAERSASAAELPTS